jgi:hypothetical protein
MTVKVKSADTSATKWVENAGRADVAYATEAVAAAGTWETNTKASKENYHKAITASGITDRFAGGVAKAGAGKYARKIVDVAKDRFGPGITAAKVDYTQNVAPFLATIAGLSLTPRGPRGDPKNYDRVTQVGKALSAKRLAQLGVSGSSAA